VNLDIFQLITTETIYRRTDVEDMWLLSNDIRHCPIFSELENSGPLLPVDPLASECDVGEVIAAINEEFNESYTHIAFKGIYRRSQA